MKISLNHQTIKKIFFYRICGTGMGACATLFKEAGFEVAGCDSTFYPPMSDYLKKSNISLIKISDVSKDYLKNFDLIVVGNVIPKNSNDAKMIEDSGAVFTSFPQALGALILNKQNVVGIAGTHGKTTTTYLMTQIFENLGQRPGYFIGGVVENGPSSRLGDGSYFFIESDEYDCAYFEKVAKFRHYQIAHLILTSLEYDHADIYENFDALKNEFCKLLENKKKTVIYCSDYEASCELIAHNGFTYGKNSKEGPFIDEMDSKGTQFRLKFQNEEYSFTTNIVGHHNILNLTSCLLFALCEGFDVKNLNDAIKNLKMVKRRQELRGAYHGVSVIDDFAHHPRAIFETLDSLKKMYPDKKLIVVLDPASATARSDIFQKEYIESLQHADIFIMAKPIKATTAKNALNLDATKLVSDFKKQNGADGPNAKDAFLAKDLGELLQHIDKSIELNPNSVLAILSNSTCLGLWESSFAKEITSEIK